MSCAVLSRYSPGLGEEDAFSDEAKEAWAKKSCDGGYMKGCLVYWKWLPDDENEPLFVKACNEGWQEACEPIVRRRVSERRYREATKIWERVCGPYDPHKENDCDFATYPEWELTERCTGDNLDACGDLSLWLKAQGRAKEAARYRKKVISGFRSRGCQGCRIEPLPEFPNLR